MKKKFDPEELEKRVIDVKKLMKNQPFVFRDAYGQKI